MTIGGAPIGWDENSPSDNEAASLGDDRIRSVKTSVRAGLDSEHVWGSSGGTVGVHRAGSARVHVGLRSAVSSGDTDGRMMWTSDTSDVYHVGSSGKNFIGGARTLSLGSVPASAGHQWIEEFGQAATGSAGTVRVNLASAYSGHPFVWLSLTNGFAAYVLSHTTISTSAFSVETEASATGVATSNITFFWRSLGSRVI